jgi:acyl-CoA thioester hydrolase
MSRIGAPHRFALRVYYEDTDLAGIVYYANYLKFIERGRSEYLRALGVDQRALKAETGLVFAVRRVEADYLAPAHFDDHLCVTTAPETLSGARIVLRQDVERAGTVLFSSIVTIVCLGAEGRPARLPKAVVAAFGAKTNSP